MRCILLGMRLLDQSSGCGKGGAALRGQSVRNEKGPASLACIKGKETITWRKAVAKVGTLTM